MFTKSGICRILILCIALLLPLGRLEPQVRRQKARDGRSVNVSQPAGQQRPIKVRSNVHVSSALSGLTFYETFVAADPEDAQRLIGCSMFKDARAGSSMDWSGTMVFLSTDGGASWQPTLKVENVSKAWDPSCTFGRGGTALFLTEVTSSGANDAGSGRWWERTAAESVLWLFRSNDGGKTWSAPTTVPQVERPYVAVDYYQRLGNVYISGAGQRPNHGMLLSYRSTDGGITLQALAAKVDKNVPEVTPGNNLVLSDGTYVVVYSATQTDEQQFPPTKRNADLKVVTSSDGGETFSQPVVVTKITSAREGVPSVAVDSSGGPFQDRIYLVWCDYSSGRGEIFVAHSKDKGKSWSRPLVVSDDRSRNQDLGSGPHNTMPVVAVNRNGVVGVMWYDRREQPDNIGYWVRFAASMDGGESFSDSVKVSDAPASIAHDRIQFQAMARGSLLALMPATWPGHTAGLTASADGIFHAFWVDNRTRRQQIWTTGVEVRDRALRNGAAALEQLDDVTKLIRLDVSEPVVNWATKTATVEAFLTNRSQTSIDGPVKVRVLSLRTLLGAHTVAIMNAENREPGVGAIWDFTAALDGGKLRPGQRSKGKRLIWQWTDLSRAQFRWLVQHRRIFDQQLKILGRVEN